MSGPGEPGAPVEKPFAARVLKWSRRHGRKNLPWQTDKTPYRVWVSEVMLQQTRAAHVAPYFLRFMARYPNVRALAAARPDTLARLWSGLGYYARAQNLRKAAKIICADHNAELPDTPDGLLALPGVGRSTAGAILALCHGRRLAILDGNVKRVLARHRLVEGDPGRTAVANRLWDWSQRLLPAGGRDIPAYTQAIMDLGSTVCTRKGARCDACPVASDCLARIKGRVGALPEPRTPRKLPVKHTYMLFANHKDLVLLLRRPATGIWAGLLSPPEADSEAAARAWARRAFGGVWPAHGAVRRWPVVRHTFSHFHLDITPLLMELRAPVRAVRDDPHADAGRAEWCKISVGRRQAPSPVKRLLSRLQDKSHGENGALREVKRGRRRA